MDVLPPKHSCVKHGETCYRSSGTASAECTKCQQVHERPACPSTISQYQVGEFHQLCRAWIRICICLGRDSFIVSLNLTMKTTLVTVPTRLQDPHDCFAMITWIPPWHLQRAYDRESLAFAQSQMRRSAQGAMQPKHAFTITSISVGRFPSVTERMLASAFRIECFP